MMKSQTPDRPGSNQGEWPRLDGLCDVIFLLIHILTAQKPFSASQWWICSVWNWQHARPAQKETNRPGQRRGQYQSCSCSIHMCAVRHPVCCLFSERPPWFSWSVKQSLGWDCWRQTETNMNQTANLSLPPLLNLKYFPQLSWMHSLYPVRPW